MNTIIILLAHYWIWRRSKSISRIRRKRPKERKFWVRPIFQLRNELGAGNNLIEEMRFDPDNYHYNFFRMHSGAFDRLLVLLEPHIIKSDLGREPISTQTRLAVTLRYLASGDSMISLSYLFRLGKSTVSNIISETLEQIWKVLKSEVLSPPNEEKWREVAKGFKEVWNYPNCVGAIDGKHVWIQAPPHAGSTYYNYKGTHSLVLMAVFSHQYEFLLVDIGGQGRSSDGGIFRESAIGQRLMNRTLAIPEPQLVSDGRPPLPFVIVGDEAFPLMENLMRPYPGREELDLEKKVYNYRHSRARRISENGFGILVAQWRIFSRPIIAKLQTTENIIKATVCLHNFLIKYCKHNYIAPLLVDNERNGVLVPGAWRNTASQLTQLRQVGANMYGRNPRDIRDVFKDYFNEEGAVPWQWDHL